MKRILCLLVGLLIAFPAWAVHKTGQLPRTANTFAPLRDYAGGDPNAPKIHEKYLMSKMMRGETIRASLDMGKFSYLSEAEIRHLIARAYEKWFLQTAEHIRRSKRAEEFKDVLPILDKGVRVEFVKENPDIAFHFVPLAKIREDDPTDHSTLGFYKKDKIEVPSIFVPSDWADQKGNSKKSKKLAKFYATLFVHEIGHSIGFADTYEGGRLSSDQLYGTVKIYPSVMDSMYDEYKETNLSCDDATGVINLMDITRNYTQRGGEQGWHSLCPKAKEYFVHNISPLRKSYKVEFGNDRVKVTQFSNDKLLSREYPFSQQAYSPLEGIAVQGDKFDALNRMIRGKTPRGEVVYINLLYESRTLVALRNGKVVYYRQDLLFPNRTKTIWAFYPEGLPQLWILEKNKQGKNLKIYKWQSDGKGGYASYTLDERKYDKKGRFVEEKKRSSKPTETNSAEVQKSTKGNSSSAGTQSAGLEQQLETRTNAARLDQFVKDFKADTKSKGKELVF